MSVRKLCASPHAIPVAILVAIGLLYWAPVLFLGQVLLPGNMLAGFAPFGPTRAPFDWNILQWDGMAQYYPWRVFAAHELRSGHIPLWNPYQFSGAPFIANGQSAVFYPLNVVFWILDPAYAFGVSAFLHSLLASLATYFLAQRWKLSKLSSVLAGLAFAYCGYMSAWAMLPTLANTAAWLPVCLLLLEKSGGEKGRQGDGVTNSLFSFSPLFQSALPLAIALACALFAGHAQIFFYILVALLLRALFAERPLRHVTVFGCAFVLGLMLSAIQLLPTMELARLGHRAGTQPTAAGWEFLQRNAMPFAQLPWSLSLPVPPLYSFSENFCYVGLGVLLAMAFGLAGLKQRSGSEKRPLLFALTLAAFGVLYAMATPLSQLFYFTVPGLSQMGGVGRAFLLWSLGAALLAGVGLDWLLTKWKTAVIPAVFFALIGGELLLGGQAYHTTSPRESVYPTTPVTTWLQQKTSEHERVLFLTPRGGWLPREVATGSMPYHPPGVLPPNGAMVYGLHDVNGYDSLAPRAYREFVAPGENLGADEDISPALNGNMILLQNINSPQLEQLGLRYVVTQQRIDSPAWKEVLRAEDCLVYERRKATKASRSGQNFSPGWTDGKYQPASFRLGLFISLCTWMLACGLAAGTWFRPLKTDV